MECNPVTLHYGSEIMLQYGNIILYYSNIIFTLK